MPRTSKPSAITSHSRHVRQERSHGKDARCKLCGESNPAVLVFSRPKLCESCFRAKKGRATVDDHHVAGSANSEFTVELPATVHRIVSDAQNDWEPATLQNPDGCPLRAAAAKVQGFAETCKAMIDALLILVAALLVSLSEYLNHQLGSSWWVGTSIERFAPVLP